MRGGTSTIASVKCDRIDQELPPGLSKDLRPFVYCKRQKKAALMDSGACLCVVPRNPKIHKEIDPEIRIKGANNKPIPVYSIHKCTFQLGVDSTECVGDQGKPYGSSIATKQLKKSL